MKKFMEFTLIEWSDIRIFFGSIIAAIVIVFIINSCSKDPVSVSVYCDHGYDHDKKEFHHTCPKVCEEEHCDDCKEYGHLHSKHHSGEDDDNHSTGHGVLLDTHQPENYPEIEGVDFIYPVAIENSVID